MVELPNVESQVTLSDQLYTQLVAAIIEGRLPPGARLHADEVAEQFEVSRIPVREAFRALAAEGWIDIRPRKETVVASQTERELRELVVARRLIGVEVARLAAIHRTDADLAELDRLVAENQVRFDACDIPGVAHNNEDFHIAVAIAGHNRVLVALTRQIEKRNRWYFSSSVRMSDAETTMDHRGLLDAIRTGDAELAAERAGAHVDRSDQPLHALGITLDAAS
jgi:DNA-binding GntR family transcriptional regulator